MYLLNILILFRYLINLNLKWNDESRANTSRLDDSIRYIRHWGSLIRNLASQKCKLNVSCRLQSVKSHPSDSYTCDVHVLLFLDSL